MKKRRVQKLNRDGNVVETYGSVREAAKKNYMDKSAVYNRCAGKVKDTYGLDGFDYRYEPEGKDEDH